MTTPPGWHLDPYGSPGLLRYWDGQRWTESTRPAEGPGAWGWGPQPGMSPAGQQAAAFSPEPEWSGARQPGSRGPTQEWTPPGAEQQPSWPAAGGEGAQQPSWGAPPQVDWGRPPERRPKALLPLLVGGGVVVAAVIVVVLLVTTGVFEGEKERSPVTGRINDPQSGMSYAALGGAWRSEDNLPTAGGLARLGFGIGESAHVMETYENGRPYLASAYSGLYPSPNTGGSLETQAKDLLSRLEPTAYPAHTRKDLESKAHRVGGHTGWLLKVKFSFPQAKARNWNFSSEIAVVVLVDRGSGVQPAEFYVSIPDSHEKQGDLDLLLSSLKVS